MKGWDPLLIGWFALGGTLLASYLSYMIIERPFLKIGTKRDPVHK